MPEKILVATPDLAFGEWLRSSLAENGGYAVTLVRDGSEVLLQAASTPFALVILDAELPGEPFIPLARSLAVLIPGMRLMVIPPENNPHHPSLAGLAPHGFVNRPFYLPELLSSVHALLTSREARPAAGDLSPLMVEKSGSDWTEDAAQAGQQLSRLLFETSAQAALITFEGKVWASAGQLGPGAVQEAASRLLDCWECEQKSHLARYLRIESSGSDHLLYAAPLLDELVLALLYDPAASLTKAHSQAAQLVKSLTRAAAPEELPQAGPAVEVPPEEPPAPVLALQDDPQAELASLLMNLQPSAVGPEPADLPPADEDEQQPEPVLRLADLLDQPELVDDEPGEVIRLDDLLAQPESADDDQVYRLDELLGRPEETRAGQEAVLRLINFVSAPEEGEEDRPAEDEPRIDLSTLLAGMPPPDPGGPPVFPAAEEWVPEEDSLEPSSPPANSWEEVAARLKAAGRPEAPAVEPPDAVAEPGGEEIPGWLAAAPQESANNEIPEEIPDWLNAEIAEPAVPPVQSLSAGETTPLPEPPYKTRPAGPLVLNPADLHNNEAPLVPAGAEGKALPTLTDLVYTCILIPERPENSLSGELAELLAVWFPQYCLAFGWRLEGLAIYPEYVQWTVQLTPTISPGSVVRILRQRSSERIFERFPQLRYGAARGDFWAQGYLAVRGQEPPAGWVLRDFLNQTRQRQGYRAGYPGYA